MGYNTTVVILNDALEDIAKDPRFGANLARAIRAVSFAPIGPIEVHAGSFMNAAIVVESHHSSEVRLVSIGHNTGEPVPPLDNTGDDL